MERKNITNTAKFIISAWNIGLFVAVWVGFYNDYTFDKFWRAGAIMSCIIYAIIYLAMCNVYKAFRIASTNIGEIVFAQVVAFGLADLILYVECCLIYNRMVSIWPGVATVLAQISGSALTVLCTKRYFMHHVQPKDTLVIYGKKISADDTIQFAERLLDKYKHLFAIKRIMQENDELEEIRREMENCRTVILYEVSSANRGDYLKLCSELHKSFYYTPNVEDLIGQGASYKHLLDTPLMKYEYNYENCREYGVKRILDVIFSICMLILFSPIFLIVAVSIKLEDHGPVFYRQERCTKDGKVFRIIKFRSMVVDAEKDGVIPCVGEDERVTKVGKVIRKYRMDELPQLINILKGDMSVVGPRPERVEHVQQYTKAMPEFAYRLRVKGGLTGYAQIFGKYNTSAYDKLRLDLMYIENQSLLEDLKIIILTFRTLFQKESTEGFEKEKSNKMNQRVKLLESVEMNGNTK
jgi:exopolysaccharide biosynthesis polyprenyl glycosylphosphotransferase